MRMFNALNLVRIAFILLVASVMASSEGLDPKSGHHLAPGDWVSVAIVEYNPNGLPLVVTEGGELDIQPVGLIPVSGQTLMEAASTIKQKIEREFLRPATVRLRLERANGSHMHPGNVLVDGEVRRPGIQELEPGHVLTVSEAILKAGGLGAWGNGNKVKLTRLAGTTKQSTVINYSEIITKRDLAHDPVIQDGDRIYVPKGGPQF
jgi:protein involved in polysaccharide export with SLBB domain